MNIIPIVFAFDNNLILPACVCISSLLMNAKEDTFYNIFILHSKRINLQKEKLDKIMIHFNNCKIQYRTVDDTFDDAFEIRGITASTYYRLMIPEFIPEYKTIFYSDVDVIFREDLSELYMNTDITGYYVAGVNSLSHLNPSTNKYYNEIIGIDSKNIIYAGNILMNSELLRSDNVISQFKKHVIKKYRFQDMDILNVVCQGKIKYLSPSFCLTTDISEYASKKRETILKIWSNEEIENALEKGIVHYNGQKPWKGVCINFDIWWEYYRKSPFYDEKFYFNFFYSKLNEYDQLSLWKRIKILIRFFVYGKKTL